jgi:hypothetical protein
MGEPFDASYLKIARAKRHVQELENVIAQYLADGPADITSSIEGNKVFVTVNKLKPVPVETSAIVGDFFHNLRSALDLMACELCGPPGKPDATVRFPFCAEESELDGMIKRRGFDKAGADAVRLMKELKPYKSGNVALRAIHDLNIRDKHKMLIVHPMKAGSPIIDTQHPGGGIAFVGDPNKPSSIEVSLPDDCALAGKDLIPTLHDLVELTTCIVESFKALQPPPREPPVIGDDNPAVGIRLPKLI